MPAQVSHPNAETLELAPPDLRGSTDRLRQAARGLIAVVEGSGSHSGETQPILRVRLQAVATIFCAAFLAFLILALAMGETGGRSLLLPLHLGVTLVLGGVALLLYRFKNLAISRLRLAELVVFGGPALLFVAFSQYRLEYSANLAEGAHLVGVATPWILLIFTYALFIPNTWGRALAVIGTMGMAPIAVIAYQWGVCEGFQQCMLSESHETYFSEHLLVMILAVVTATVGVQMINELRRQYFAARQLGQYRLKQLIGSGGMGEVYLAEHEMLKRPCAIKLIRPEKAGDPKVLARFEREVRSTAKLSHWNSIDIFVNGFIENLLCSKR